MNELIQLLKDKEVKTEESSTSLYSYHTTPIESFKRIYSVVETILSRFNINLGPSCSRNDKEEEEEFSSILEQIRGGETSTSKRNMKESSFNKEYEICLKTSYETDTIPGVKPSYAQLFRKIFN